MQMLGNFAGRCERKGEFLWLCPGLLIISISEKYLSFSIFRQNTIGDKWRILGKITKNNLRFVSITKQVQVVDRLRSLRHNLNLSQASFAAKLGVSVRTVNRWENGHAYPSKMALKLLEDMMNQHHE